MLIRDLPYRNAIKIGRFFYPPEQAQTVLGWAVRMVAFESDGNVWRSGSCTLVRRQQHCYVITTRHELGIKRGVEIDPHSLSSIRISTTKDGYLANILTDLVIFEEGNPDEEYHDLLAFRSASREFQTVDDSYAFFPCDVFRRAKRHTSVLAGCPALAGVMDYDNNHIRLKTQTKDCKYDPSYVSAAKHVRGYTYNDREAVVDGFSGGAVFSLFGDLGSYEIALDGIVLRGGNGHLHVVDTDYLIEMLER